MMGSCDCAIEEEDDEELDVGCDEELDVDAMRRRRHGWCRLCRPLCPHCADCADLLLLFAVTHLLLLFGKLLRGWRGAMEGGRVGIARAARAATATSAAAAAAATSVATATSVAAASGSNASTWYSENLPLDLRCLCHMDLIGRSCSCEHGCRTASWTLFRLKKHLSVTLMAHI